MNKLFKTALTLSLFYFLTFSLSYAQNPEIKRTWHWYFGYEAGIDFSNGYPELDTSSTINSVESCATISDTSGNLLFYTDGITVWDANHDTMPNGIGLLGCNSAIQGALIVPVPDNNTLYYILTTDCEENNFVNGLRYSVVDMSLNGGLGDVVSKNNILCTTCGEKLAAVYHCNEKEVWVMSHEQDSNKFFAYLITSTGIDPAVVSSIGVIDTFRGAYLKFSPNGKKLALATVDVLPPTPAYVELYDFDNETGIVSNVLRLSSGEYYYGLSFSSDNSKLYSGTINKLYQYDLLAGDSTAIINSKTLITTDSIWGYRTLQLGPDGRIYVAKCCLIDSLGIIKSPNSIGLACNYIDTSFYIFAMDHSSGEGLPNFVESYFNTDTTTNNCETGIEEFDLNKSIILYPNPTKDNLFIQLNTNDRIIKVQVYNTLGKLINVKQDDFLSNIRCHVDLSAYTSGIYFINLQTYKGRITKKIILTK